MDEMLERLCQALEPQYEAVRLIGRGAMGTVYLFHEIAADRPVAVKVLPGEFAATEEGRERFRREARVAANLRHPNIVPIFTFGETEDLLFYVMQYVEGESLGSRIDREGRLPPEDVADIVKAVSDALAHAHDQGIVHRDIKPENILIERRSGRPMLTDFGIAHMVGSAQRLAGEVRPAHPRHLRLTGTGMAIGSPIYMAPEQADGTTTVDHRADIYALGTTAYEALTGHLPYIADNLEALIQKKTTGKLTPVRSRRPDAPPRLARIIERCLAPSAKSRWSSAEEIKRELGAEPSHRADGEGPRRVSGVHFWLIVALWHLIVAGGLLAIAVTYLNVPMSTNTARLLVLASLPITLFAAWRLARPRRRED
jgi:serine/threonine-protein kinase